MRWILTCGVAFVLGLAAFLFIRTAESDRTPVTFESPAALAYRATADSPPWPGAADQSTESHHDDSFSSDGFCDPQVKSLGTRQEVLNHFGRPHIIDASGNRWTYNNLTFMFRGDKVIGLIKSTPNPAAAPMRRQAAADAKRVMRRARPTHVSVSASTGRQRPRVIYGNSMGRSPSGPWVYGLTRLGTWHNAYNSRNFDGAWQLSHTEYGRMPVKP